MIPLQELLILSGVLFAIGLIGAITRRNIIMILLSLEILLAAVNLAFVAFSYSLGDLAGQVVVFFVMIVAAAEVTVGLAIAVVLVRQFNKTEADDLRILRW
ncbi:MAG: NADH-quinone oxidoreductase subunit NuoK [Candidatus Omnitrophica bacterium]|nr:NADH-quinone oxidoreductase subunit NuoK [Candidatus Omnitrophota bacterium]